MSVDLQQPATSASLRRYEHLYIGGEWVKPIDGELIESIDPATGRPWALVPMGGLKDIDRAVAAAREALNGPWRRMPGHERAALLRRFADLFRHSIPELVELESRDSGGLVRDLRASLAGQVQWYQWFASLDATAQPFAIADIPLLYEVGLDKEYDEVIVTSCTPQTQVKRIMARDNLDAAEVQRRLDAQLPLADKVKRATYVIDTNGSLVQTNAQVHKLYEKLTG